MQLVFVGQQDAHDVLGQLVAGIEQSLAASQRGLHELLVELGQLAGHLGAFGVLVAREVSECRTFDEAHQIVVQAMCLLGGSERAIDAGRAGGQVHHHLVAQVDEFGPTSRHVRSDGLGNDRRKQRALVQLEGLAAEQTVLEATTIAMLGPVQVHEHVTHDHFTGVVQRLTQILLAVRVLGLLVRGDRDDRDVGGAHGLSLMRW